MTSRDAAGLISSGREANNRPETQQELEERVQLLLEQLAAACLGNADAETVKRLQAAVSAAYRRASYVR